MFFAKWAQRDFNKDIKIVIEFQGYFKFFPLKEL